MRYVDGILCTHHNANAVLIWLHKLFPVKLGFGKPDMYLSAKLHKTRLHNGAWAWAMSPVKYAPGTVRNCIVHLAANYDDRFRLQKN